MNRRFSDSNVVVPGDLNETNAGAAHEDECHLCGKMWTEDQPGWPLCDTKHCPNTICRECTSRHGLSVSAELFYCPTCAGSSSASAAAQLGGVATSTIHALTKTLGKLPASQRTLRTILHNLYLHPEEPKYRILRLENKRISSEINLEPIRNVLDLVGFVQGQQPRAKPKPDYPSTEAILHVESVVDRDFLKELIDILDGLLSLPAHDDEPDLAISTEENDNESKPSATSQEPCSQSQPISPPVLSLPNSTATTTTASSNTGSHDDGDKPPDNDSSIAKQTEVESQVAASSIEKKRKRDASVLDETTT